MEGLPRGSTPHGDVRAPDAAAADRTGAPWLDELLLVVVVLLLTVPVMQPLMAQQASRYTLTAAMWDHRTIVLDDYAESLTVDYAQRDGHLLSDKAPGQPLLALPAYDLYRLLGGEPAVVYRPWGNLGLWFVSVWSSSLPAALLGVLVRRRALALGWRALPATAAALGLVTATLVLPFATQLFSHVLTAVLLYASLYVLRRPGGAPGHIFLGGTLAAVAVTTEYTAALGGVALFVVAARAVGVRAGWFLAGGVLPAVALAVYHTAAFGGPLVTGYRFSGYASLHEAGFFGVTLPSFPMLVRVLAGDRGLLVLTPIVLVGVLGCIAVLGDPERRAAHGDAAVGLALVVAYALLMGGWSNPTGGASPGARYAVPAIPFLVPGVAYAFDRWPAASWAATAFGWITMGLATYTLPLAPREEPWALSWWWERLLAGGTADTLLVRWVATGTLWVPILLAAVTGAGLLSRQRFRT